MPLQSKINNPPLFFKTNELTNSIIRKISELQDELDNNKIYISKLKVAIEEDIKVINASKEKHQKINEAISIILKLKFLLAAVQKVELADPVFRQVFANEENIYQKAIKVSKDKTSKHKKTNDFIVNKINKLRTKIITIDGLKVELNTIEACDAVLTKLNGYKSQEETEIFIHENHMVEMSKLMRETETEIIDINHSIKDLEIEHHLKAFFQLHNQEQSESVYADKLSIRSVRPY